MRAVTPSKETSAGLADMKALARAMEDAFRSRVNYFKHAEGVSTSEAVAFAEKHNLSHVFRVTDCPPEEVEWDGLMDLHRHSPVRALERWQEVEQAALEELQSGNLAANSVMDPSSPNAWQRAQFMAIRRDLVEACQPRNGVERQLIDQMAIAQSAVFFWQQKMIVWGSFSDNEPIEQAADMVDRFNRLYLRTLRALCNLRKVSPAVVVQNLGGQVNIGEQQVNVAPGGKQ